MNAPSPNEHSSNQRMTLLIIWGAMLFSMLLYCVIAVMIADTPDRAPRPNPLQGPLAYLPYILPLALLAAGLGIYRSVALAGSSSERFGERPKTEWGKVKTGFIVMLALFEMNVIAGLALFFMGMPIPQFFVFAGAGIVLMVVGLWRLLTTWPQD